MVRPPREECVGSQAEDFVVVVADVIGELAAPFRMTFAGASKHIKALERAGLVRRTVRGRTHVCRLDPKPLANAHEWLRYYEQFWSARLDLLQRLLTEPDQDEGESDE